MAAPDMSIGELAARAGVATSALRYYQRAGLLRPARRVSGRRRYDEAAVARLDVIRLAKNAGFTIAEMRTLLRTAATPSLRWRSMARRKLAEVEQMLARGRAMQQILQAGLACECPSLFECAELARAAERTHR